MSYQTILLLIILPLSASANASPESIQLALALKQLDGVQLSLERAQQSAGSGPQSRYHFDYLQAQQDISAIRQGIRGYLSPSRAQPRAVVPLSANYQREQPDE